MAKRGLSSLIGLVEEKRRADICIKSCRVTGNVFPHTLVWGPGGVGKTEFCRSIADELLALFVEREAASFKKRSDITDLLKSTSIRSEQEGRPAIIFFDEIHRLSLSLQETFYFPMKEFRVIDLGGETKLRPFTLVCATTRKDMLDEGSFVRRFPNVWEMHLYKPAYLQEILSNIFIAEKLEFTVKEVAYLATRCLGNPRQAHNLSMKVRDYVLAHGSRLITLDMIHAALELEHIDSIGLTDLHKRYLVELNSSNGEGRGVEGLAGRLGQSEDMLRGTIEPMLLQLGFIDRTHSGRKITDAGRRHLLLQK